MEKEKLTKTKPKPPIIGKIQRKRMKTTGKHTENQSKNETENENQTNPQAKERRK
jgi:hypothetical protein